MNTDRLIDMLSAELEAVNNGRLGKTLILAIVTGGAIAFALMLVTVGPRPDLQSTAHLEWVAVKLLFALSVIGTGALLLNRSMRPGLEDATNWTLVLFPFLAALAVAFAVLLGQPQAWREMLRGATTISSMRCLLFIMFFCGDPVGSGDPRAPSRRTYPVETLRRHRRDCRGRNRCSRLCFQLYERYDSFHSDLVRRSDSYLRGHWIPTRPTCS